MKFSLLAGDGSTARAGMLQTSRGEIRTPVFMPVGTLGSVKGVTPTELRSVGAQIILANSYHLMLRPGHDIIATLGGLHRFSGWDQPILTDSGGFQVFSLGHLRHVDNEGVNFRSHIDGSLWRLTPERSMEIQALLGSDIIMAFDEPSAPGADRTAVAEAMDRTHRWAERCFAAHTGAASLFPICQGGTFVDLRRASAAFIGGLNSDGYAIGGLSLGEPKQVTWQMVEASLSELPPSRPRYLMGVGAPEDLIDGVARGVDMFDCVLPTRLGRNGAVFTPTGKLNLRNARLARDSRPIQEGCDCEACEGFSLAYLHHLFRCEELLGYRLASIHNLRFLIRLMEDARRAILAGAFDAFHEAFNRRYTPPDETVRAEQRARWRDAHARWSKDAAPLQPSDAMPD